MRRMHVSATVIAGGLLVSWLGQGIWRTSPDALWAAVAVVSVLSAGAIALEPALALVRASGARGKSPRRPPR